MRSPFTIFLLPSILLASKVCAQADKRLFRTDGDYISRIKVTENSIDKPMAWGGGLNHPQFAIVDLNHDGKNDLVIFEKAEYVNPLLLPISNNIKTFLNSGTPGNPQYTYAPQYEYLVPYPQRVMKMLDYNCDKIPDLIYGDIFLNICDGYYNSSGDWTTQNCRVIYEKGINPAPLPFNSNDIPGVADIDSDSDLDFVALSIGTFHLYKDVRQEESLPCDTVKFKLKDWCWGKVGHAEVRESVLGVSCNNSGLKMPGEEAKTTGGSTAICLFDADGDGDYDALVGEDKFADIQFLKNGKVEHGYPVDTMIAQDTVWQTGGHKLHMASFPTGYWLDIDDDNDNDIVIAPQADENYRSAAYYRNIGSQTAPAFTYQTDSFLVEDMIDAGSRSYPSVYDYNKDGKKDLFIGGWLYQPGGTHKTSIIYLENTSTGTNVSFKVVTRDFLNIGSYPEKGAAISIGDMDGDGMDELVAGRDDGSIICFKNHASSAVAQPDWQLWHARLKGSDGTEINVGKNATPFIYDIDKDGKNDLVVGTEVGYLTFYKNIGATGQISLEYKTNKLGDVRVVPDMGFGYSAPYIGPIDNSGVHALMVGSGTGAIYRYSGFENGNVSTPYKLEDSLYSDIKIPGQFSSVSFADMFDDNKFELFIGNGRGGVFAYRQVFVEEVDELAKEKGGLQIYPNPAKDRVKMTAAADLGTSSSIRLVDNLGRLVTASFSASGKTIEFDVSMLPSGIYTCIVNTGENEFKGVFVKE
ncbi:T9SS type A sorting domain-containing protein [Polluticoccus soli]|uniref:T9SS type A sorting domain-containing protein n=1 Tax=Polluticoccus soli TaxID=3034150 RepID=UPI0023E1C23E|nr:T9SS type A sorting domain-containing protein [Flavipsychrobacter sp. JY13-12]